MFKISGILIVINFQEAPVKPLSILRRQIFVLRILGLYTDDTPTIVHAESSSTVRNVIQTVSTMTFCFMEKLLGPHKRRQGLRKCR